MGNNTRIATLLNGAISLLAVVAITLVCIVPTAFAEDGANTSDAPGAGADNSVEQIAGPVPNIIITNFTYGDGSVAVGSTFNLGFTFQNMGKVAVSNMVVTVDGGENFAISGGTNTFYYDALNAGAALTQTVPMQTLASAKNGAQGIDISFKYEYVDGAARSSNTSDIKISVPVSQPDRFELNDPVVPNIVNAGEETTITMDYVNKGKGDVAYNFTHDNKIKRVHVSPKVREHIIAGHLVIVCLGEAIELLPKVIADKIAERDPSLVVQIKKTSTEVDADDPYAAFQVPDDLMW